MICPKCNFQNQDRAQFCTKCGQALHNTSSGKRIFLYIVGLIVLLLVILVGLTALTVVKTVEKLSESSSQEKNIEYKYDSGDETSTNIFLKIPVSGIILTSKDEIKSPLLSLLNPGVFGYEIKKQLMRAATDGNIKGVVLEIISPGGEVGGARAIVDGVEYYRKATGKPVFAHISGLGTSAAYYAASSTDYIMADEGAMVANIGVLIGPFEYYNKVLSETTAGTGGGGSITTENGIEAFYISAGKDKDFGFPYKRMSQNAQDKIQAVVDQEYNIFVGYVSSRRNIPTNIIKDQLGALIYSGSQSAELRLVDAHGNKDDAYKELARKVKVVPGDYKVVVEQSKLSALEQLLGMMAPGKPMFVSTQACILCNKVLSIYGDPQQYSAVLVGGR